MGSSSSKKKEEENLKTLINSAQNSCVENINKIKNEINSIKEEIIISLNQKDLNASKTNMGNIIKEKLNLLIN